MLDTRNKRASAIGFKAEFSEVLPMPDGVIDDADRLQAASEYSGMASGAVTPGAADSYQPVHRPRRRF